VRFNPVLAGTVSLPQIYDSEIIAAIFLSFYCISPNFPNFTGNSTVRRNGMHPDQYRYRSTPAGMRTSRKGYQREYAPVRMCNNKDVHQYERVPVRTGTSAYVQQ